MWREEEAVAILRGATIGSDGQLRLLPRLSILHSLLRLRPGTAMLVGTVIGVALAVCSRLTGVASFHVSFDIVQTNGLLVAGFQADRIGLQGPGIADFGAIA